MHCLYPNSTIWFLICKCDHIIIKKHGVTSFSGDHCMGIARHHSVLPRDSDMSQARLGAPRSMVPCMHSAAQHAARKAGIVVSGAAVGAPWASQLQHARSGRASLPCPTPFDPFRSPVPAWISCSRATAFRTEAGRSRAPRAGRGRGPGASNTAAAADRRLVLEEVTKCRSEPPALT